MTSREELYDQVLTTKTDHIPVPVTWRMPKAVLAEVWTSRLDIQQKWQDFGFMAVVPIFRHGVAKSEEGFPLAVWDVDHDRAYGVAMDRIQAAVDRGELTDADEDRAYFYMLNGDFETSELAQYLPGPDED